MDYPRSVPSVGLVNGRFVDEDAVAGTPGSLISASWGNSVTEELLNVIRASGTTPVEGVNNQLLTALRGKGAFDTAPKFDASNKVATTEFVQRALGSYSGQANYDRDVALAPGDVGKLIALTAPVTVTLPEWAAVAPGGLITVFGWGGAFTVQGRAGDNLSQISGASSGPMTFTAGTRAVFRRNLYDRGWSLDDGDAALKYSPMFSASYGASGFQRHPSGIIDQWGICTSNESGDAYVTFPVAFPNGVRSIVANHAGTGAAMVIAVWNKVTNQGCQLRVFNHLGNSSQWLIYYRVVGY
ncbi:gp53-like domain-containing protein [Pseudomonas piscis]|uniref:gp53-like domain-containing protein n=1 Tax=Pseudomonas piscis TaxID=2614538 RepID=UPI0015B7771A|nr:phage tail protein [Pseudomonas piscis]